MLVLEMSLHDTKAYGYMMEDLATGKRFKLQRHDLVQRFRPGNIR